MRLPTIATLLSLLALSRYTNAAAVVGHPYRTELLGYSPARGEFQNVVGNTLTHQQGYVRYLDSQGVQHIIGYKYPAEPVQQSRRITNEEYLKQLIKLSLNKDEAERSKARDEHFRLWSMNQYDQYRQEIERLKAAGQEPTADLLTKVKTFEDIIIATRRGESSTDGATTEETAQIKQVRDEHLRLWNAEAALLRSEQMLKQQHSDGASIEGATPAIHLRFQSAQADTKSDAASALVQAPAHVEIVGETAEQKKAREEHLRIYHLRILEELQKQAQFNAEKLRDSSKSSSDGAIQQSTLYKHPQYAPTITTNEKSATKSLTGIGHQQAQGTVTATDVEHQSQGNVPVAAVQDTIEVQRAREEHLKLLKEAFSKASEYQAANAASTNEASSALYVTQATDKLAEQLNNKESEEEARLRIEEAKQHEAERLAEEARLKEEARLQAEELKRLQLDEQRRQEQERLELTRLGQIGDKKKDDEHLAERPQLPAGEEIPKQTLELLGQKPIQTERNEKLDADVNSQLLRFGGNQVGGGSTIPTTAYFVGAQQPIAQQQQQSAQLKNYAANPGYYYLRDVTKGYLNVDKPYILQYIPNQQQLGSKDAYAPTDAIPLTSALAALNQIQNYEKPIEKPLAQLIPIAPGASPFSSGPIASAAFVPASAPIAPAPALFAPVRSPITAPIAPFAAISPSASLASITPFASSSNAMKIDYGSDPGLAALEKATRDHFRAHEIALEQLRLSNQKQPTLKDCY
ncbi:uncharacterized abhydrolase domain-containing protein DDB_G0269086 [Eurosta solidaginis]|uniref:uncharacterized abhydrolase domain-containing protein DDB_G0269086 n=1 Tax=Eurosta solidaginis TaxID=178769 RepID=UPI00353159CF